MNKQQMIIAGVIGALILGVGAYMMIGRSGEPSSGGGSEPTITPTPTEKLQLVDESVQATLDVNARGTAVDMTIIGLNGQFSGLEYELSYDTDEGPKGSIGGTSRRPITIDDGEDTFTRSVELGSCSTGGKCRYHKGVKNFKLSVKLHTTDGSVQLLQEEFPEL
jgi:hypothetical protein